MRRCQPASRSIWGPPLVVAVLVAWQLLQGTQMIMPSKEDSIESKKESVTTNSTNHTPTTSTSSNNRTVITEVFATELESKKELVTKNSTNRTPTMTPQQQAWLDFEAEIGRNFSYVVARFHNQEGHWADMVNDFRNKVLDQGFPEERFHTYVDRNVPAFLQNDPRYREHLAFLDNSTHPSSRGAGHWFWKPLLIQHHLNMTQWGEFVVYCDADNQTGERDRLDLLKLFARKMIAHEHEHKNNNSTNQEFNLAIKRYRDSDGYCCPEKRWNKGPTYQHFCPDRNQTNDDSGQYHANFLMIKKTVGTVEMMEQWAEAVANYYWINDVDNPNPNFPAVQDHRHDQSVMSLLLKCRYSADTQKEFFQRGKRRWDFYLVALSPSKNATTNGSS